MNEKRKFERIRCYYYLKVYDRDTRKDIGSVIDISTNGIKIIGEGPFTANTMYHFSIHLPKGYMSGNSVEMNAEARWCNKNPEENYYEAGFKFSHANKSGIICIKSLINDFKSNELL